MIGSKLFIFLEMTEVLTGLKNRSRNNSYIQVGLEERGHICVGRKRRTRHQQR